MRCDLFQAVLVFELFNAAASVDELLLTRKEWMAGRANVKPQFFFS